MPLFELEPDAVDRVYAASLFELAEARGGRERLESVSAELDEIVELTRQMPELSEFMASRILGTEDRAKSLDAIFKGRASDLILNFLHVLNRKERLNRFLSIVSAYQHMVQEKFGRIEVDVYTRHPIDPQQLESIKSRLREAVGREPVMYAYTEPAMIGGLKIQIGDRLYDASIATQLRNMRRLMSTEGAGLIRAKADRAFEGGLEGPGPE